MSKSTTVTVLQSAQPTFFGVRVGVMLAGFKDDVPTVRLVLRADEEGKQLDLSQGQEIDLFGRGTVRLDEVTVGDDPARDRAEVTLTFTEPD